MAFLNQSFSALTTEIIIAAAILVACLILAFILGKSRMVAFNLSFYPAILIYLQLPEALLKKLLIIKETAIQIFFNNLLIFLIFFILTFFIINAIAGRSLMYSSRRRFFQLAVLAVSAWILIILSIHQVIALPKIGDWLPTLSPIFSSAKLFFWFLAIPLALIILFVRK